MQISLKKVFHIKRRYGITTDKSFIFQIIDKF